jgi:chromosome segregation ATPase
MAKESVSHLKARIKQLEDEVVRQRERASESRSAQVTAETALKESRTHFADLKERLADSEANLARLSGYIDRVREDDNARDGFDVVDQTREIIVPRRKPASAMMASSLDGNPVADRASGQRRRHWTDY